MHRGCRQGGQSTPGVWNEISAEALAQVQVDVQRDPAARTALPWAPEFEEWSIVVFADNWYLLGTTIDCLQRRARIVERVWTTLGHTFGSGSLEILPNEPAKIQLGDGMLQCTLSDGRPFKEVQKLVALGVAIDNKGSTEAAVGHRVAMATRLWWGCKGFLTNKKVQIADRIRSFYNTVGSSLLFGSGGWTPSKALANNLGVREGLWIRQILGLQRRENEDWVGFWRRQYHRAHKARARAGLASFAHRQWMSHHGWLGHLCRLRETDKTTLAAAAQKWKDTTWWRHAKAAGAVVHNWADNTWRHKRPGRLCKRLEEELCDHYGDNWEDRAIDRQEWWKGSRDWLQALNEKWRGPKLAERTRTQ